MGVLFYDIKFNILRRILGDNDYDFFFEFG